MTKIHSLDLMVRDLYILQTALLAMATSRELIAVDLFPEKTKEIIRRENEDIRDVFRRVASILKSHAENNSEKEAKEFYSETCTAEFTTKSLSFIIKALELQKATLSSISIADYDALKEVESGIDCVQRLYAEIKDVMEKQ